MSEFFYLCDFLCDKWTSVIDSKIVCVSELIIVWYNQRSIFEHVHYFFSVKIQIQRFFFSLEISNENQRSKIGSLEFDSNESNWKCIFTVNLY